MDYLQLKSGQFAVEKWTVPEGQFHRAKARSRRGCGQRGQLVAFCELSTLPTAFPAPANIKVASAKIHKGVKRG